MKTKNIFLTLAITAFVFSFTSCKKDNSSTTPTTTDSTTEASTQVNDQINVTNEMDEATDDANAAVANKGGSYNQRPEGIPLPWPCDTATITTNFLTNPRTITITYNGSLCNSLRTRTGNIVISFDSTAKWSDKGAVVTITFNNLKITSTATGKSIVINGVRTLTNVSGGLLTNLLTLGTVTQEIKDAGASITFDDGSKRTWTTDLIRVFTYNSNNGVVLTTTGNVSGENRYGHNFSCTVSSSNPLVITQCSGYRYVSGQIVHTGYIGTTTATFGLTSSGGATDLCTIGLIYYQIGWTGNGGRTWTSSLYPY